MAETVTVIVFCFVSVSCPPVGDMHMTFESAVHTVVAQSVPTLNAAVGLVSVMPKFMPWIVTDEPPVVP